MQGNRKIIIWAVVIIALITAVAMYCLFTSTNKDKFQDNSPTITDAKNQVLEATLMEV